MDYIEESEKSHNYFNAIVALCGVLTLFFIVVWILLIRYNRLNQKRAVLNEEIDESSSQILLRKKTSHSIWDDSEMTTKLIRSHSKAREDLTAFDHTDLSNKDDPYTKFLTNYAKSLYRSASAGPQDSSNALSRGSKGIGGFGSLFLPPLMPGDGDDITAGLAYKDYFIDHYLNPDLDSQFEPPHPIPINRLMGHVKFFKDEIDAFRAEHSLLPIGHVKPCEIGSKSINASRNRYSNVLPYDHTRVKLAQTAINPDGYINANYIDGYNKPAAFIATQGPLKEFLGEFWEMVWRENSPVIIMLTRIIENRIEKCDKYWPASEQKYGNVTVRALKCDKTADYVILDFEIRHEIESLEKRILRLYWFLAWPDHGVPIRTNEFLSFYYFVKAYDSKATGPPIIHCSAGVGRTGTFIGLDSMIDMAKAENAVDIFGYVKKIREQRCNMVQSAEQYEFLYESVLEALISGGTFISIETAHDYFTSICSVDPKTSKTYLEEQWRVLGTMAPPSTLDPYRLINPGRSKENSCKNRDLKVVPKDNRRPILKTVGGYRGATDYINATFVNGYGQKDNYIVTQWPIADTRVDLWKLVWEQDIRTIILLHKQGQSGSTSSSKHMSYEPQTSSNIREDLYWPCTESSEITEQGKECPTGRYYGMFYVELVNTSIVLNADFGKVMAIRTFKVANLLPSSRSESIDGLKTKKSHSTFKAYLPSYSKSNAPPKDDWSYRIVKQFQLLCWKNKEDVPPSTLAIQETIERSNEWQKMNDDLNENFENYSLCSIKSSSIMSPKPILVQDYDGFSKAGLYLSCCYLYDQIRVERGLNVYLAIKSLRTDRPEFVCNFLQYQFLYKFAWQQILFIRFQGKPKDYDEGATVDPLYAKTDLEDITMIQPKISIPNVSNLEETSEALKLKFDEYCQ